jgi:hypothetical protein
MVIKPAQNRVRRDVPDTLERTKGGSVFDIGKNSFHVVGLDDRGAIVLRSTAHPSCVLSRPALG